jgi:hypothetical protein
MTKKKETPTKKKLDYGKELKELQKKGIFSTKKEDTKKKK